VRDPERPSEDGSRLESPRTAESGTADKVSAVDDESRFVALNAFVIRRTAEPGQDALGPNAKERGAVERGKGSERGKAREGLTAPDALMKEERWKNAESETAIDCRKARVGKRSSEEAKSSEREGRSDDANPEVIGSATDILKLALAPGSADGRKVPEMKNDDCGNGTDGTRAAEFGKTRE
jgi:hypothetical protein